MTEPENTPQVPKQPGVSAGRLCLLLLNVLLLLAFVTLTALNGFAPAQGHGARRSVPTATASASAPTQPGDESNSGLAPRATEVQTAAVSASATVGHTATHAPATPTAVPPTATPSPVISPSPTASPTPCGYECG